MVAMMAEEHPCEAAADLEVASAVALALLSATATDGNEPSQRAVGKSLALKRHRAGRKQRGRWSDGERRSAVSSPVSSRGAQHQSSRLSPLRCRTAGCRSSGVGVLEWTRSCYESWPCTEEFLRQISVRAHGDLGIPCVTQCEKLHVQLTRALQSAARTRTR